MTVRGQDCPLFAHPDRLILRRHEQGEQKTEGGLLLPTGQAATPCGVLVECGPDLEDKFPQDNSTTTAPTRTFLVFYRRDTATVVEFEGEEYLIVDFSDVLTWGILPG